MQSTISLWQAILVSLGPAAITAGALLWNQYIARNKERELKELELEEARLKRLRDERIQAYLELTRLTYTYQTSNPAAIVEVLAAYAAIELLNGNSETKAAAEQLKEQMKKIREVAAQIDWNTDWRTTTLDPKHRQAINAVLEAREDFLQKARAELEIDTI